LARQVAVGSAATMRGLNVKTVVRRRMKLDNDDSSILNINDVTLPTASFGVCKYWRKCDNVNVELGNDVCMECYDKGRGGKRND